MPVKNDHAAPPTGGVYLSNRDLADRYGIDIRTVRHWRIAGVGPRGVRLGRHVRYAMDEVRRWEREQARKQYPGDPRADSAVAS